MKAYEDCMAATSTSDAPWYIVPADHKKSARLIVSRVIVKTMRTLRLSYPQPDLALRKELRSIRDRLTKA